jgi:hypothetical protein
VHQEASILAFKKARKLIEARPESPATLTLSSLVVALETETTFLLADLHQLDYDAFGLSLEVMIDWRLDRSYASKIRLLDVSVQAGELRTKLAGKANWRPSSAHTRAACPEGCSARRVRRGCPHRLQPARRTQSGRY